MWREVSAPTGERVVEGVHEYFAGLLTEPAAVVDRVEQGAHQHLRSRQHGLVLVVVEALAEVDIASDFLVSTQHDSELRRVPCRPLVKRRLQASLAEVRSQRALDAFHDRHLRRLFFVLGRHDFRPSTTPVRDAAQDARDHSLECIGVLNEGLELLINQVLERTAQAFDATLGLRCDSRDVCLEKDASCWRCCRHDFKNLQGKGHGPSTLCFWTVRAVGKDGHRIASRQRHALA